MERKPERGVEKGERESIAFTSLLWPQQSYCWSLQNRKMGGDDVWHPSLWQSCPMSLCLLSLICPYLSFISSFLSLFFTSSLSVCLSTLHFPFSPSRLPDESRADSAPGEEEMGKDIFITQSFLPLSFKKRVRFFFSTWTYRMPNSPY